MRVKNQRHNKYQMARFELFCCLTPGTVNNNHLNVEYAYIDGNLES